MDSYNPYNFNEPARTAIQAETQASMEAYVGSVMRRVYLKMFVGLLITAFTSVFILSNTTVLSFMFAHPMTYLGLAVAELALVFVISGMVNRLSTTTATLLFFLYSVLNGVSLTPIFLFYTQSSIALTFFITAGTFGAMSLFGYFTKQDLSKMGGILMMALIGLIICLVVNIFLKSSMMDWIISIAGVAIFVGLTAWDTQDIKRMAMMTDQQYVGKVATIGALSLYLDFINLFIYLLRIFGSRD